MVHRYAPVIWALCGFVCVFPCQGQEYDAIEVPDIRYTDASPKEFNLSDLAQIGVSVQSLQQAGGVKNLRARLFADTKKRLTDPLEYMREGCMIYRTQVVSVLKSTKGIVIQSTLNNPVVFTKEWLSKGAETTGDEQWYVMVLEKNSRAERLEDLNELLKLRPADAKTYFQHSFQFVLKGAKRGKVLKEKEKEVLRALDAEQQKRTQTMFAKAKQMKVECLGYRMLKFARTGLLAPCACGEDAEEITPVPAPTVIVADF